MDTNESPGFRKVRGYMTRNLGVASREELLQLGHPGHLIDSWVRSGRLVRVAHGVYSLGRDVERRSAAYRVALLATGPDGVLAGRSACEVWGLVAPRTELPGRVTVASRRQHATVIPGCSPALARTRVEIVHRELAPGEIRRRSGLIVTTPARSLVDFAAEASPAGIRFAFLEACGLGLFTRRDVDYCFDRIRGRRGARNLRGLLALWEPELNRIRSVLEGLFLLAWIAYGGPMPLVNRSIYGYQVDNLWPDHGLVVELDGRRFHGNPAACARDAAKDRALRGHGLTVVRYGYEPVNRHPNQVVREVAGYLDALPENPPAKAPGSPPGVKSRSSVKSRLSVKSPPR